MSARRANETEYVRGQYATSKNLDARIALHQRFSTAPLHFHDWLWSQVTLAPDARILEIGCGSGALWQRVHARVPTDARILLSDFSLGMVTQARANLQALLPNLDVLQCDAQDLPFADEGFDVIFANHMLYHLPAPARGAAEIRRVLKRGRTLYAATNGMGHMRELGALVTEVTGLSAPAEPPEAIFGLENGASLLAPFFESVRCEVQENNLRVTEVEPLVAYAASGWMYRSVTQNEEDLREFRRRVQREIDRNGAFHITKAVGLFICR
jgi:SAM-dependent methyltransferase